MALTTTTLTGIESMHEVKEKKNRIRSRIRGGRILLTLLYIFKMKMNPYNNNLSNGFIHTRPPSIILIKQN